MNEEQPAALKKRGRPALEANDRTLTITVRLSTRQYDAICQKAQRDGVSVASVLRRAASGLKA